MITLLRFKSIQLLSTLERKASTMDLVSIAAEYSVSTIEYFWEETKGKEKIQSMCFYQMVFSFITHSELL